MKILVKYPENIIEDTISLFDENGNDITIQQFSMRSSLMLDMMHLDKTTDLDFGITYNPDKSKLMMSKDAFNFVVDRLETLQASIDWEKQFHQIQDILAEHRKNVGA